MYNTFINGVQHVWLGISIFLLLILSFSRTTIFKNALTERHFDRRRLVLFTVLFSAMAVSGTYWSVSAGGGIINFRAVGIMLAGFIGGPAVGSITGLIAGLHRAFFINTDASYIHGGLSILQGIAAGFTTNYLKSKHHRLWLWALIYAFLLEVLFWAFFALLTWPETVANPNALALLSLPILITNTIAVSLFIGVLEVSTYIWDSEKTKTTKNTFDAIQMIFSTLQAGFKDLTEKLRKSSLPPCRPSSGPLSFIKAAYISVVLTKQKKTGHKAKRKLPYSGFRNHFPTCPMYSHCRFAGKMKSSDTSLPQKARATLLQKWELNF